MPDYSSQNLAVTQAWDAKMRAEAESEREAEEMMRVMETYPHKYQKGGGIVGFCARCGVNFNYHGQDFR